MEVDGPIITSSGRALIIAAIAWWLSAIISAARAEAGYAAARLHLVLGHVGADALQRLRRDEGAARVLEQRPGAGKRRKNARGRRRVSMRRRGPALRS